MGDEVVMYTWRENGRHELMICVCFFCCAAFVVLVCRGATWSSGCPSWCLPRFAPWVVLLLWCCRGSLPYCELEVPVGIQGAYLLFVCFSRLAISCCLVALFSMRGASILVAKCSCACLGWCTRELSVLGSCCEALMWFLMLGFSS